MPAKLSWLSWAATATAVFLFAMSCRDSTAPEPIASLSISPSTATLYVGPGGGGRQQLTVSVLGRNGTALSGRSITWSSSAPGVAAVSSTGLVTALDTGRTTVTATAEGKSASAFVTVAPVPVGSVATTPASITLHPNDKIQLTAILKDSAGTVLTGRAVTWSTSDSARARVSSSGIVSALSPGQATITAAAEGKVGSSALSIVPIPVAGVTLSPRSATVTPGTSVQLQAVPRDSAGNALSGRNVEWTSGSSAVATVSAAGLVLGVAAGQTTITASCEGKSDSATIVVRAASGRDWAIVGARYTQGVQDSAGTIPVVLGGGAVVFDVLLQAVPADATPVQIALHLTDQSGTSAWTDSALVTGASNPSWGSPSAQFLVPASALRAGLRWQVLRDPRGALPDDSAADDVYPRGGPAPLPTVTVPTLTVRFVPIVLAANGNATGAVSSASIPEYLRTVRSIHPLGAIEAYVGASFVTNISFGTPPSGGDPSFWTQLLAELDLARVADTASVGANWYGVVRPPSGFNYTTNGGWSYIPASGTATGPNTRTSLGVQLNWFSRPTQARDLVAHELGHTFGRLHAPCGGAGAPLDPYYPVAGGTLDVAGEDVYSWATGLATSAAPVPTSTGDVMGYCFPVWASSYTYKGVLQFRGTSGATTAAQRPVSPERVLVVRGTIERGRALSLLPAFVLRTRPGGPERTGPYRLEGLAADGSVLFRYDFAPAVLDHDTTVGHFTFAIPFDSALEAALATLRLQGPEGEATLRPAQAGAAAAARPAALAARTSDGGATVTCPAGTASILVQSGTVLGSALGATLRLPPLPSGTRLGVLCSDGMRTTALTASIP